MCVHAYWDRQCACMCICTFFSPSGCHSLHDCLSECVCLSELEQDVCASVSLWLLVRMRVILGMSVCLSLSVRTGGMSSISACQFCVSFYVGLSEHLCLGWDWTHAHLCLWLFLCMSFWVYFELRCACASISTGNLCVSVTQCWNRMPVCVSICLHQNLCHSDVYWGSVCVCMCLLIPGVQKDPVCMHAFAL